MSAKVLVVDDEPNQLRVIAYSFQQAGYDVVTAESGAAALRKIEEEQPDVVLLDVMLPDMSGLEVCERIRGVPETRSLPVIMVTALEDPLDRSKGLAAGANDYVIKPIDFDELGNRVRALVERTREQLEAGTTETKILVVDDEPGVLRFVAYALEAEGFEVVSAASGKEGLAKTETESPDLVILDVRLPDMSGLQVCKRIRAESQSAGVPIILLTASTEVLDKLHGLEAGADRYITKPVDSDELVVKVQALLERTRRKAPARSRDSDRQPKLLLVEDEPNLSRLMTYAFEAVKYDVVAVGDGGAALEAVGREDPDVVLLDIALPDMSGLAVCEQLRANPNTADLPVIMLSVLIDVQDRIRGFKAGADEYLSKPVDSDELIASVSAIVERARQRAKM